MFKDIRWFLILVGEELVTPEVQQDTSDGFWS